MSQVDHYLGKVGMKAIVEFRKNNFPLLRYLGMPSELSALDSETMVSGDSEVRSDQQIQVAGRVKVVMKEMEDTAGRSSYYDEVSFSLHHVVLEPLFIIFVVFSVWCD